jgi:DNA/RNA-binding domain of Phe-tRNA-synthetase-like protein
MKTIRYTISPTIFDKVGGYIRGLVVVRGADNTAPNRRVQDALREAEKRLALSSSLDALLCDSRIVAWRDAFKILGMNPSEFRPAHEALARRAVQSRLLPFINSLVDIGNAMSLEKLMPVRVHPIGNITGPLSLRPALGSEIFVPFGPPRMENPKPGEIVFANDAEIHARAWVWRQAQCSVTLPATTDVVVHVDALPSMDIKVVSSVCDEVAERIGMACGGTSEIHVLSASNPETVI